MKSLSATIVLSLALTGGGFARQEINFDDYFHDATLRVDYYHIGDSSAETFTLDALRKEGGWAGDPASLIDPFGRGRYRALVYDAVDNRLIYSRGFDSYFGEFKTTAPAKQGMKHTFHETVLIPLPRDPVRFVLEGRDRENLYHPLWTLRIDPADYHIIRESVKREDAVVQTADGGDPHHAVDLVVLAEGYIAAERPKFEKDLRRFTEILSSWEPYKSHKDRISVRGVFAASPESGVDEPRQGVYRNTLLNATFNALDEDRYLLTESTKSVCDLAGVVPYDDILIMVNSKRYGGGGIYNFYTIFTSDGPWNEYVFVHEFAHAFAELGDEYYTSQVTYEQFYPPGVEPAEPNITALLDPSRLKWKDLVTPGLPIPTPWGQEQYDSLTTARDSLTTAREAELGRLRKEGAPDSAKARVEARFTEKLKDVGQKLRSFMENHPLRGKIGAFQGGGYIPKGLYRPTVNSIMNQFDEKDRSYYAVNTRAIEEMIRYYTR